MLLNIATLDILLQLLYLIPLTYCEDNLKKEMYNSDP